MILSENANIITAANVEIAKASFTAVAPFFLISSIFRFAVADAITGTIATDNATLKTTGIFTTLITVPEYKPYFAVASEIDSPDAFNMFTIKIPSINCENGMIKPAIAKTTEVFRMAFRTSLSQLSTALIL